MTPTEVSRFVQGYAKKYHVGAFGVPTTKELASGAYDVLAFKEEETGTAVGHTVILSRRQRVTTRRKDWCGNEYLLPEGANVAHHVARDPHTAIPSALSAFDYVFCYAEDMVLVSALYHFGFRCAAVRISAASEIINVMASPKMERSGVTPMFYPPHDLATVKELPMAERFDLPAMLEELSTVDGWYDDYPFYSDGTWSAVSLRGFYPADPSLSVKPSEMPRKWKQEHPYDLTRECGWTVLAEKCPAMTRFANAVSDAYGPMERVRLMRMTGRGGRGGKLGRHTDITDRNAGTKDGQIVRIHVPLVTDPRIKMLAWELDGRETQTHLPVGRMFYLDQRKPHAVVNPTPKDRVHLTIDVVSNPVMREALA